MAVNCAAFSSPLRARALPCLPHCGALGYPPTQLRGRAPAFVGAWRQARRHGGLSVLRNCSTGGRRCCSCRSALFRLSELFDGRSALLFRSVSAVPSFGTFPQLDKSFPQIPEKLLTNVRGGAILISHLKPQGLPAERQTESARERCSGFAFRRDSGKPVKLQRLAGFFFACGGAVTFAQASSKPPQGGLRWLAGGVRSPPSAPPWGRVWRGGGVDDGGQDNRARSA